MSRNLFFILLAIVPMGAQAEIVKPEAAGFSEERLSRIGETMQHHMDAGNISGAVTLVARRGRIVHLAGHGLMDIETRKPMTKDAIFRVFSMSKPVAGVAILMLMEQGKVRLNDAVSKFIPEFKGMQVRVEEAGRSYTIPALREMTIQDLLTHVSGLGSGPASTAEVRKILGGPGLERLSSGTLARSIPAFAQTALDFQPGSRWAYSALAGFDTLGRVVEVASGSSFEEFLKQNVFVPLGMKTTGFHPGDENWPRVVSAYHRAGGKLEKTENPNRLQSKTYFSGAGGLVSTAEDYAQFAMMLGRGGQWNGKRLLSPKTVELMASAFVPDTVPGRARGRGFGLSVQVVTDPIRAGLRVSAGSYGWDGAYGTHFWVDPKEQIVGVMMIQTDNPDRQLDRDFENAVMQAVVE